MITFRCTLPVIRDTGLVRASLTDLFEQDFLQETIMTLKRQINQSFGLFKFQIFKCATNIRVLWLVSLAPKSKKEYN